MATSTQASGAGAGAGSTAGTTGTADVTPSSSNAPGEGTVIETINTDVTTPVVESEKRPAMKDLKGVRYSGIADERRITVEDLKRLGVDQPQTDLTWNARNGFLVPATDLNAATVDALIELPGFSAV